MINTTNTICAEERRPLSLTYNNNILKIGTHNVRGFNSIGKQLSNFISYESDYELDIIGLTETKTKKIEEKIWSKIQKKIKNKKSKKMQLDNIDELDNPEIVREFNKSYSTW